MALLHFLKHGESTPRPHLDHIGGSPDVSELTDVGVEQARKVGRYLSRMKLYLSIVAVSTAHQTMETASLALEMRRFVSTKRRSKGVCTSQNTCTHPLLHSCLSTKSR